jgi:colanic acid/amylovoran biosynthesis glycosyltransferase
MRLAYLTSAYPAISHTFILREVEALRRRGIEIETFAIRPTPPDQLLSEADRKAAAETVSIRPFRAPQVLAQLALARRAPRAYAAGLSNAVRLSGPGPRNGLWQLFYFLEAVVLWRECERRGIRHIHAHLANVAADVAMLAAEIGTAVDPDRPWSWSFTMHGPTELYDVRHFRLATKVRRAAFVVCISDFARSQLMAHAEPDLWERLHVVHVGIPVDGFTPPGGGNGAGDGNAAADGTLPTVLYIGRLVPEKGQAVLLEAFAALAAEGVDARLVLAGEGEVREALEARAAALEIAERVSFLGAVGQDRLHALYSDASVFCLPSFAEGVPVVLMEAMAMGVPVVTTRIAGIPELVEDGRGGLLVAPGRADELAAALRRLLLDAELRHGLAAGGRDKVLSEFDAELTAADLERVFRQELAGS